MPGEGYYYKEGVNSDGNHNARHSERGQLQHSDHEGISRGSISGYHRQGATAPAHYSIDGIDQLSLAEVRGCFCLWRISRRNKAKQERHRVPLCLLRYLAEGLDSNQYISH